MGRQNAWGKGKWQSMNGHNETKACTLFNHRLPQVGFGKAMTYNVPSWGWYSGTNCRMASFTCAASWVAAVVCTVARPACN